MRVIVDLPKGNEGWAREFEMEAAPRTGDSIWLEGDVWTIRHVEWYPKGDYEDPKPFVYVVLKP